MARGTLVNEIWLLHSFDKAASTYLMKQAFEVLVTVTIAATCLMQVVMAEFMFNDANERFKAQILFDKWINLDISRLEQIATTAGTQAFVITNLMREFAVKRCARNLLG